MRSQILKRKEIDILFTTLIVAFNFMALYCFILDVLVQAVVLPSAPHQSANMLLSAHTQTVLYQPVKVTPSLCSKAKQGLCILASRQRADSRLQLQFILICL